jgi:ABC-2 type transport system permease protein
MKYLTKKNRAILREMVATDFKVRYQGSALGYVWSLLRPLLQFTILFIVFVYIFKLNRGVEHFPTYLFMGIVLWNFFTEATSTGMTAIVSNGDLIRKISIPRFLVVVSTSVSALINLALNLIVVVVVATLDGLTPGVSWLLMIPILLELFILSQAVAFFLCALYVKFRDINYIWEVITQAAFYATPILYALTMVPERFRQYVMLNPMAQIIQDARHAIIGDSVLTGWQIIAFKYAIIPVAIVAVTVVVATWYFRRESKVFAENL